jgi:hypothetical protein
MGEVAEQQIIDALNRLRDTLQSVSVHTWHGKETSHAALLSLLSGTQLRANDPKRLHRSYSQVYSQHGEDGYIAEIFSRIGAGNRTFLEIGIGNGLENTTRFLLEQGWSGVWIEGNEQQVAEARALFSEFVARGSLRIMPMLVERENINQTVAQAGLGNEFDLISIDIDYNTSHIWRALSAKARACCIEYNASIPPSAAVEVPYSPDGVWDGTNYFGAGLKVIEQIGAEKGMGLVGCDLQGVNAFLVRNGELQDRFCAPFTAENHYELPKYSLLAHIGHAASRVARNWQV